MGHAQIHEGRMKGDDAEIDTAQASKRLDGRLTLLEKIQKTFTESIPNNITIVQEILEIEILPLLKLFHRRRLELQAILIH